MTDALSIRELGEGQYQARAFITLLADSLAKAEIPNARRDAALIAQLALDQDEPILSHHDLQFDKAAITRLKDLMARRLTGCPVSRLRGYREFYSLHFELNEATLDPRPDSEALVEAAIFHIQNKPYQIADFGTGSGCLLLASLAHCPQATGIGLDISQQAVIMAEHNAASLGLADRAQFLCSHWDAALAEAARFDVILSNPPYISVNDAPSLRPEVRDFEPPEALFAGITGLQAYEALLPIIAHRLLPAGKAFIEIGQGQEEDVCHLASLSALQVEAKIRDLSGIIRCLTFVKEANL